MLSSISIQNLGLIESAECHFHTGFTVITGETGAGKSFLCNALEIGLGGRIKKMPTQKTVVEVECFGHIFRRVIDQQKSRFFIDDLPESLGKAEEILSDRFHFHRQHDTQFLLSASSPAHLLDSAMHQPLLLKHFQESFERWNNARLRLEHLKTEWAQKEQAKAFWQFSLDQMKEVQLSAEELERAEELVQNGNNWKQKQESLQKAMQALGNESFGVLTQLQVAEEALQKIQHPASAQIGEHILPLANLLETLEKECPQDNAEQEQAMHFLDQVKRWCKSHGVIHPLDLLAKKTQLQEKLADLEMLAEKIEKEELALAEFYHTAKEAAEKLSAARRAFIPEFEQIITQTCQQLGMPPAQFQVQMSNVELCKTGFEQVQFLFSANKNQPLAPLSAVASGGEKSRIMLALHQCTSENTVLIFDEIDTGVSGAVAEKMASLMKELAKTRQVIAITHLAQIASKANHHIIVSKTHEQEKTVTRLQEVHGEERIEAIAKLLAGEKLTEDARNAAKRLMEE